MIKCHNGVEVCLKSSIQEAVVVDLQSILAGHRSKLAREKSSDQNPKVYSPSFSEIPDIFFDDILVRYKLSRSETLVLMYLYRKVWASNNIFKKHGISQLLSHTEMANFLGLPIEDIHVALRKLEEYAFIEIIRSGQYFVRRYFTKDLDDRFEQTYDNFEN